MKLYVVMNRFVDRTNPASVNFNAELDSIWSTEEKAHDRINAILEQWAKDKKPCIGLDESDPNGIIIQMAEKSQSAFFIEERELNQRSLEFDEKHPDFEQK